jgi:hypothetical protein
MSIHKTVMDMTRMDEEYMSPEEFLRLPNERRREIAKATPFVRSLGSVGIDNSDFVSMIVKWKMPRYKVRF